MRISSFAVVSCLLSAIGVVKAIFEEQAGEFDWRHENIGVIEHSVVLGSNLIVATEDGALANLDQGTGSIRWRAVLPSGSKVFHLSEVEGQVLTVTSQSQGWSENMRVSSVQCWSARDGGLLWETLIDSDEKNDLTTSTEVVYHPRGRQLVVLYRNALHFLSLPATGSLSPAPEYWTWSAADASSPENAAADTVLVLSSLVTPSASADSGAVRPVRTAVGCYMPVDSDRSGYCDGHVVLVTVTAPSDAGVERVGFLTADQAVHTSTLLGAVSSDGAAAYQWDDLMFGLSSGPSGISMLVWPLAGSREGPLALPFPAAVATGASPAVRSFIQEDEKGALAPGAVVCAEEECFTAALRIPSSKDVAWALRATGKCAAPAGAAASGGWAAVYLQPHRAHSRVAVGSPCVSTQLSSDGALAALHVGSAVLDLAGRDLAVPYAGSTAQVGQLVSGAPARSPLSHLAILPQPTGAAKARGGCHPSVLAVLVTGQTALLRPAECAASGDGTGQWVRHEALARVQQAVVVDNPVFVEAGLAQHAAPSLQARLTLQVEKLKGYASKTAASLQRAAAHVQEALQDVSAALAQGRRPGGKRRAANRDVDKLRMFGFDKTAVLLSYSPELKRSLVAAAVDGVAVTAPPFQQAGLQLTLLNLLQDPSICETQGGQRVFHLTVPAESAGAGVTFVKLLHGPALAPRLRGFEEGHVESDDLHALTVAHAVVGLADGRAFIWEVTPDGMCSTDSASRVLPHTAVIEGGEGSQVVSLAAAVAVTAAGAVPVHTMLRRRLDGSHSLVVVAGAEHQNLDLVKPLYVHSVDRATGRVTILKTVTGAKCTDPSAGEMAGPSASLRLACAALSEVATADFDVSLEQIVDVSYPAAHDPIHVWHSILGDDSVLVKYLNPHVALVTTISSRAAESGASAVSGPGGAGGAEASGGQDGGDAESAATASAEPVMFWTLLDTVTGKVVLRLRQEGASLPVHNVLVENHIVSTYWNSKAKRTELSSVALFDGVIDNTELTPFASSRARSGSAYLSSAAANEAVPKSAYSAVTPIAMQKTYVLPRAVTALQHTVTAQGLSNKNILVATQNGQVYSVDMRQVHPRRPFSDPSPAEKSEGLVRYSPFVALMPLSALTLNYTLPRGAEHLISSPSLLESSGLVLSYGETLDLHLNRVMPSQDFDLLSSDFNYYLLVAILCALASVVMMLRNMQRKKHLRTIWA